MGGAKKPGQRRQSTLARMKPVREIFDQYYEEGNQAKNKKQVWLRHIYPKFGICYHTMLAYINEDIDGVDQPQEDKRQLKLFDDEI